MTSWCCIVMTHRHDGEGLLWVVWGQFDITLGSLLAIMASLWDHIGISLGSRWGHFGVTLGSVCHHFWVTLGSFSNHFRVTSGSLWSLWDKQGISLRLFWSREHSTLGSRKNIIFALAASADFLNRPHLGGGWGVSFFYSALAINAKRGRRHNRFRPSLSHATMRYDTPSEDVLTSDVITIDFTCLGTHARSHRPPKSKLVGPQSKRNYPSAGSQTPTNKLEHVVFQMIFSQKSSQHVATI